MRDCRSVAIMIAVVFLVWVAPQETAIGASARIVGKVQDNFDKPLSGVRVTIPGSAYEATTDGRGQYTIPFAPGSFSLKYEREGYSATTLPLNITAAVEFPAQTMTLFKFPPERVVSAVGLDGYQPLGRCTVSKREWNYQFSWDRPTIKRSWYLHGSPTIQLPGTEPRFAVAGQVAMQLFRIPATNATGHHAVPFYEKLYYGIGMETKTIASAPAIQVEFKEENQFQIVRSTLQPGMYAWIQLGAVDLHEVIGAQGGSPAEGTKHCYLFAVGGRFRQPSESPTVIPTPDRQDSRLASLIQEARRHYNDKNWQEGEKAYKELIKLDRENFEAHAQLGSIYIRLGDFEKSKFHNQKAMNLKSDHPNPYYNMACTYAKMGETERAIALLKQAVAKGFKDFEWMRKDPDLESIREDPRFKSLSGG